jgi:hypothetical protein
MSNKINESLVIRRRPNDRMIAIHKINGQTVGRIEIKRYATDADVFLTGAGHAVEKLAKEEAPSAAKDLAKALKKELDEGLERILNSPERPHLATLRGTWNMSEPPKATPPDFYRPGDKVLVRDDLKNAARYGCETYFDSPMESCKGKVVALKEKTRYENSFSIIEEGYKWTPEMFAGKIVPCGELREGDEVLVKGADTLDTYQAPYADKVIRIEHFCALGCCVMHSGVAFDKEKRFVGKLIRPPKPAESK